MGTVNPRKRSRRQYAVVMVRMAKGLVVVFDFLIPNEPPVPAFLSAIPGWVDRVLGALKQDSTTKIYHPPGHFLLQIAEFVCSKKTFTGVLEPTIHDLREEYNEALAEGRVWKARFVRVRGYWAFFNAAGLMTAVGIGKKVVQLWKVVT